ncbi:TIGR02679 family protein [Brevifollis gellanilyticus]|uniref:TIGR02679 family protein n=1 Tax=Brevifollis gellanilyticus TaxID=748831 RepID=A0A512M2D5_9BACT|nr:TIGR02679 family protein [Brevifollis gellanilyticus]GEP40902.1 hypothetical protein BGE01nite_01930 [Brevifollis gellanilyticus]
MSSPQQRLRAIFDTKGWNRFIAKLETYRGAGKPFPTAVTLPRPTDEERLHHARLLRQPVNHHSSTLRYDLAKLGAALSLAQLPADWNEILTALHGPVPDEKLASLEKRLAWQHFWPQMTPLIGAHAFPHCDEWLESLRRDGSLRRHCKGYTEIGMKMLLTAARLLQALPLVEERPLTSVAAEFCGSSHALDAATPLSTLVLRGLALRFERPMPVRSDERRDLWAAVGVIGDDLSAPVLTFNLGLRGEASLCQLIAMTSADLQPVHLTPRMLWAADWSRITSPPEVYVCENPTIISLAASYLGLRCPPIICVNGEPCHAARHLMRRLRDAGCALWYHGDFDWPGIAIAERVFTEFGAKPWLFDLESYQAAMPLESRPLTGNPVSTPWSAALSQAMHTHGKAYDEERLADFLINALSQRSE